MIITYSRRLLSPFIGVVQVAEIPEARALSLDGRNWEVQYARVSEAQFRTHHPGVDPGRRFGLVATIENGSLKTRGGHPFAATDSIRAAVDQLFAAVSSALLPFAAADEHEYWLLDDAEGAPLALLRSCVDLEDRDLVPQHPSWVAMPAAQLAVLGTEGTGGTYVPPVNYRLEQAVEHRAGSRPRAIWLNSAHGNSAPRTLPPCLLREDWPDEEQRQLCERYVNRLAPRLLMLPDLPRETRRRLEFAARDNVFDVDRFHAVYPEVVEDGLLKAARVEARLRRHNSTEKPRRRA
jgi:hypothetical protein